MNRSKFSELDVDTVFSLEIHTQYTLFEFDEVEETSSERLRIPLSRGKVTS